MKQRLVLSKTMLHEPKVLLLDEPATGLDPLARIQLRGLLKELNREGLTILLSSHILADLEDICTRVALIAGGHNASGPDGQSVLTLTGTGPFGRARLAKSKLLATRKRRRALRRRCPVCECSPSKASGSAWNFRAT